MLEVIEPKSSFFGCIYIGQHFRSKKYPYYFSGGKIIKNIKKTYGIKAFKRTIIIDDIDNEALLNDLEIHYVRLYNTYYKTNPKGLNLTVGGKSMRGFKLSDEAKEKLKIANLGRIVSKETKKKISLSTKGIKKLSQETKDKLSAAHKGKTISEEQRLQISKTLSGYKHTDEMKEKISLALRGRISPMLGRNHSEETRKRLSEVNMGRPATTKGMKHTEEARRKISEAGKGRKMSEESKRKMSETKQKIKLNKQNNMIAEGNENKEFIKEFYTGKTNVRILTFNPTAAEKIGILGWTKAEETKYIAERDGISTARITVYLETKEGVKFDHSFFIENKKVVTKDGTKTQHVNVYGQFAYLPNDGVIPDNMQWYNTEGLRESFKGEEELTQFLMAWKDTRKGQKFSFSNFAAMFNGDFSEIKSLTSNNVVGVFTGIKQTFGDDGVAKYSQVIYPKLFVKQYTKAENTPNSNGGTYKGYVELFTTALEGTRNAGGALNIQFGIAPYTFTKVEDPSKLPWLTGDNAATAGQPVQAAF